MIQFQLQTYKGIPTADENFRVTLEAKYYT